MTKLLRTSLAALAATALVSGLALAADTHKLTISPPSAKQGERAEARVKVEPQTGFHINTDYPIKLRLDAPDGVTLEKGTQRKDDAVRFDKDGAEFAVGFTAAAAGKKTITGEFKFAVCTDTNCVPKVEAISFDVDVK
jgi:hypothetical protein